MSIRSFFTGKGAPLTLSVFLAFANVVAWFDLWPAAASVREVETDTEDFTNNFEDRLFSDQARILVSYFAMDKSNRIEVAVTYEDWVSAHGLSFPMSPEQYWRQTTQGQVGATGDSHASRIVSGQMDRDDDGTISALDSRSYYLVQRKLLAVSSAETDTDGDGRVTQDELLPRVRAFYSLGKSIVQNLKKQESRP